MHGNIDARLIMCFLRDFSRDSARETLEEALKYKDKILGVGLDSDEHNNPPMKFFNQFTKASAEGFHLTAHADIDQKDSIEHIRELLEVIGVERVDQTWLTLQLRTRLASPRVHFQTRLLALK